MPGPDGLFWLVLILQSTSLGGSPAITVIPRPYDSDSACHAAAQRWDRQQASFFIRSHECIWGSDKP